MVWNEYSRFFQKKIKYFQFVNIFVSKSAIKGRKVAALLNDLKQLESLFTINFLLRSTFGVLFTISESHSL